jgi:hypothetical protein
MLPYDQTQRNSGYCDMHNASDSPGVYMDSAYNSPSSFKRNERDQQEIFVWGEEGAIATPPQLELIQERYAKTGHRGWDGSPITSRAKAWSVIIRHSPNSSPRWAM